MSSVFTSSAGGSFASVSFAITADGTVYLNALAMFEQRSSTFVDNIKKDNDKVNKEVDKFGSRCYDTFNSVAYALETAFSIAKNTISGLVNSFADYGDAIAKMSQRTGIATQTLSEFDYIAGQCGTNLDTFETAIKQMEKTLAGAASGSAEAQKKLADIGVAMYELQGKTPDEQFRRIAQAIASLPDPAQRAAAAMAMFGRSGTDLLPLMNSGANAIDELSQKAHELGLVLSDEDYQAAEDANDAMDNFKRSLDGVKMQMSSALTPILTKVANGIANVSGKVIEWAQANPTAVRTIAAVVAAVGSFVTGLYAATKAIQAMNAAMYMMEAHPIILAITAVIAVIAALAAWYHKAEDAANALLEAQKKISGENQSRRQKYNGYVDRLNELNSKNNLSSSEQAEMNYLVGELNAEYKDLGLTIDETTGKIEGMAEAVKKVHQEQRAQRKEDIEKETEILQQQLDDLTKKQRKYQDESAKGVRQNDTYWANSNKKLAEELQPQIDELQAQISENQRLTTAIDNGMDEYEGSIPFGPEKNEDSGPTNAQKEANSMAEDIAHANDTRAQQEVRRLEERYETIIKNRANEIKDTEGISYEEADQRAREELSGLKESVDAQIKEILDKAAEDERKRAETEQQRAEEEKKRAEEAKKAEEERAEAERKRKEEERARNTVSEADRKRAEFDLQKTDLSVALQEAINAGDTGAISETLDRLEALEKEREDFEKQAAMDRVAQASQQYNAKKEALSAAQESGDQEAIDKASKEFKEATKELAAAQQGAASVVSDQQRAIEEAEEARRRQMEEDAAAAEEASQYAHAAAQKDYESSKGTFNALEAAALGQANDYDRKIYENGEEQVRYLRYLYELQNNQQQSSAVFA